jgi:MoxR-like ATPase
LPSSVAPLELSGLTKGGEIRGKLNGIGFAQPLTHGSGQQRSTWLIRDVSLQGSRPAHCPVPPQDSVPAEEIKQPA